jgi:hypothetical protein
MAMAITMRMLAWIFFFRHRGHTRAIAKSPLYAHKTHTKVTLRNPAMAVKIQPKCSRVVKALARMISRVIARKPTEIKKKLNQNQNQNQNQNRYCF